MILRRTERDYKEAYKTWYKHGSFDKERHNVIKTRITWWLLFIPIFWYEEIDKTQL